MKTFLDFIKENYFKGGIQKGTTAWDKYSRKLDQQVLEAALRLKDDHIIKRNNITFQKKLNKDQVPGGMVGCSPDGGVWFKDGVLIAAFEAKKQGERGNAIERWWKNETVLRTINQNISYVTFATGEGATETGPIGRTLTHAVLKLKKTKTGSSFTKEFNKLRIGKDSVFMKTNGFSTEEIELIMKKTLLQTPSITKIVKMKERRK